MQAASDAADAVAEQEKPFAWELLYLAEYYYERGDAGDVDKALECYRYVVETFDSDLPLIFYAGLLAELSPDPASQASIAAARLPPGARHDPGYHDG